MVNGFMFKRLKRNYDIKEKKNPVGNLSGVT